MQKIRKQGLSFQNMKLGRSVLSLKSHQRLHVTWAANLDIAQCPRHTMGIATKLALETNFSWFYHPYICLLSDEDVIHQKDL